MLFFVYQSSSIHIKDSIKLRVNYAEFVVDIIAALNTCIVLTRSSQHCPCIGSQMSSDCGKNKEVAHEDIYIYIYTCLVPRDCSMIDLCYFTSYKSYFSSLLLLFFVSLLTYSLSRKFFNAFYREQNNREIFSKFACLDDKLWQIL